MKVETARVPVEGYTNELDEPVTIMDFEHEECRFEHPVHVQLTINQIQRKLYATGTLNTVATMCCDRCSTWFELPVTCSDYSFEHDVATPGEIIDLTESIREDIILSLPQKILCKDECAGVCVQCGQNLNEKQCSCTKPEADNPFSALDSLKIDNEEN